MGVANPSKIPQGASGSTIANLIPVGGTDGTLLRPIKTASDGTVQVSFASVAHDAVLTGVNPVLQGFYASSTTPTAVSAAGDMVQGWADLNGRVAVWDGNTTVSIDDGGGSITVDGAVTISGTATVSGTVTANAGTGFAAVATAGSAAPTTGNLTMLSDGTNARAQASDTSGRAIAVGAVAADAAAAGNPLYVGGYGSTATPTAMSADGDMTPLWLTRNGAVNIADGGGSITVDGSVSVTGSVALGVGSTLTFSTISVTTSATSLLASNSSRKGFNVINNGSTTDFYVGGSASVVSGAAAAANGGGLVVAGGGSWGSDQASGYTGAVYGICAAGSTIVAVSEW